MRDASVAARGAAVPAASRRASRPALQRAAGCRARAGGTPALLYEVIARSGANLALALLLLFSAAFSTSAFATTATSAITGRVTSGGASAAGVTVTVTSTALQGERTTVTTNNGRFWLTALPPGRYDVTFSRAKLQTLTRRVLVQLSRVARADAVLEPSEDEDHVSSTAIPISVTDTTVLTSHFSDETLDRLPMRRDPLDAVLLSPGLVIGFDGFVNDASSFSLNTFGQESLEQITVLRGALPAEYGRSGPVYLVRTRSGGEQPFYSLRDSITSFDWLDANIPNSETYDDGVEHLVEANAGGRIVPEKLWFFAGVWNGNEMLSGDRKGYEAKLTWQPAAQHNLSAFFTEGVVGAFGFRPDGTVGALRYTGTNGPRWTNEAVLSRSTSGQGAAAQPLPIPRFRYDSLFVKSSYVLGDHVLSAGGGASQTRDFDETSLFVNDRWVVNRVTMNLGVRHEFDHFSPRLAASIDLRGNGRQSIAASLSDYGGPFGYTRELALGFATAIGTTGAARLDAIRRDLGGDAIHGAQGDFRYTLFDRFHTGASYTWLRTDSDLISPIAEHEVHAWAGVDLPVGEHEFGVTGMQHYRSESADQSERTLATDLALRYSLPISRVRLTVAVDATNIFGDSDQLFTVGRGFRGWVRLRH